jgi:hypothetical protein
MVKYMLTRWANSSDADIQCEYALVKLDSDSKERLARLMSIGIEENIQSIQFIDYKNTAVFLDTEKIIENYGQDEPLDFEELLGEEPQVEITEDQYEDWEDRFSFYTEHDRTEIYKTGFLFRATLGYGTTTFETKSFELVDFD